MINSPPAEFYKHFIRTLNIYLREITGDNEKLDHNCFKQLIVSLETLALPNIPVKPDLAGHSYDNRTIYPSYNGSFNEIAFQAVGVLGTTDHIHASIASEYITEEFTIVTDSQDKILEFLYQSSMSPKDTTVNILKAVDHRMTGHKHENFAVRKRDFSI